MFVNNTLITRIISGFAISPAWPAWDATPKKNIILKEGMAVVVETCIPHVPRTRDLISC